MVAQWRLFLLIVFGGWGYGVVSLASWILSVLGVRWVCRLWRGGRGDGVGYSFEVVVG